MPDSVLRTRKLLYYRDMATVLLVEDEHDLRVELRNNLEEKGHYVFSAASAKDGMDAMRILSPPPDLIVTDLEMPITSGEDFVAWLQKDSFFSRIPVMVISGVRFQMPPGATTLLAKPF